MKKIYEIHFEIENNCFLNCKHCSSINIKNKEIIGYNSYDIKKLLKLFDNELYIYLTGGEPLLNQKLQRIIADIKSSHALTHVGLFSSGIKKEKHVLRSISKKEAETFKNIGLENCYISIYSHNGNENDIITETVSSLRYTEESIKNLLSAGINVKIHLVLNSLNIDDINNTILHFSKIGVTEIRILKLVKHGNAIKNWGLIGVTDEKQIEVVKKIFNNSSNYNTKITISGFPEMTPCRPFDNSIACQGGTNLLYVTFNGEIFPCACTREKIEQKISTIQELDKIQNYVLDNKKEYNETCLNKNK